MKEEQSKIDGGISLGHDAKNNLKWFGILNGLFQMLLDGTGEEKNGSVRSSHGWWFSQVVEAEIAAQSKTPGKKKVARDWVQFNLNFVYIETS